MVKSKLFFWVVDVKFKQHQNNNSLKVLDGQITNLKWILDIEWEWLLRITWIFQDKFIRDNAAFQNVFDLKKIYDF